jgi:5-formyltetrahydrofolate cyclo-ligase
MHRQNPMKQALRQAMRAALRAIPQDVAAEKSRRACQTLIGLEEFRSAQTVMIFLSMPHEVDTSPLALAAWQEGKRVLAPKVLWSQRRMIPVLCPSLNEADLSPGRLGIREPRAGQPSPLEKIDLVVTPALAFDRHGYRLGRGGGYYDRFLASPNLRAVACGLGFTEQVIDEVPTSGEDHPLDILVTDKEVLRFGGR